MKLVRWLSNLKIKHKLLISVFTIPIILVICVGLISYWSSTNALRRQSYEIIHQYQQSTIAEIIRNKNRYELIAETIAGNATIQTLISPVEITTVREVEMVRTVLNPTIFSFLDASEAGINILLARYNNFNSERIFGNFENILSDQRAAGSDVGEGRRQFQLVNYDRLVEQPWTAETMDELRESDNCIWAQVGQDRELGYISLLREVRNMSSPRGEAVGLLRVTITFDMIYTAGSNNSSENFNLVFNGDNELLSREPHKIRFYEENRDTFLALRDGLQREISLRDQELTIIRSDEFADSWYLISVFPTSIITENLQNIATTTIIAFIIAGALSLILTFTLSNSFSARINAIATQMQQFSTGEQNVKITGLGQDEIGYLSNAFNDMSEQISSLIYDNYISDIEKKDALLKALQAQINPHILYNSLSAISRLAELGETEEITNMVHALVKFYRMTLNSGNELLSVEDELSQLKAYLEVFRIRKGETFTVSFDIDDDVLEYKTIKVILQPFVENVFEHATKPDGSILDINVSIKHQNEDILFSICDNGIGISEDKLGKLLDEEAAQGYGIKNVNDRVKLQYGADYGVNITSELGVGTCVNILIPKRNN